MASTLDTSLVDKLLPVVDKLRGSLLPKFGVRQYVVKLVKRTWTGRERGDGDFSDVEVVVTPPPMVDFPAPPGSRYDLRPQGREEEGLIKVTEISLKNYQEVDLTGGDLPKAVQFFWLLKDAHGQGLASRAYLPANPPIADRDKTIGWVVYLRRAEGVEPGPTW
jgi:hypothetical protein